MQSINSAKRLKLCKIVQNVFVRRKSSMTRFKGSFNYYANWFALLENPDLLITLFFAADV